MFNHKITKEQFDRLFQDDIITVKEYKETIETINERINEVMKFISLDNSWWPYISYCPFEIRHIKDGKIIIQGPYELIDETLNDSNFFCCTWLWEDLPEKLVELCNEYHNNKKKKDISKVLELDWPEESPNGFCWCADPQDGGEPLYFWWDDMRPREVLEEIKKAYRRGYKTGALDAAMDSDVRSKVLKGTL